jgi:hypothetical protein
LKIGPLLLLIALAVAPSLLSALGRWLRQQIEETGGGRQFDEPLPAVARKHSDQTRRPRVKPAAPAPAAVTVPVAPAAPSVPVPAPPPRRAMWEGLGSPRDLRHGIVLAALLGPCRALDPRNAGES